MASHTATGEWQSFELRMRRRRAERLLLRANAEADQGHVDAARACLEEARELAPALPGIEAVQQKLDAPPARRSPSFGWVWKTALVAAGLAIAVIGLALPDRRPAPVTIVAARDFRAVNLDAPVVQMPSSPLIRELPETAEVPLPNSANVTDVEEVPAARPVSILTPVASPAVPAVRADSSYLPAPTPARTTALSPAFPASLSTPPPVTPPPPSPAPLTPAAAITTEPLDAAAVATSAPAASVPAPVGSAGGGEQEVRGTLDRYAAAYNDLDARAAERVWPSVNRVALSRAFEGLASQRVSLGDCRIDVNGTGARASCAGSATWAPKVGDGTPRTEARRWTFDLARHGDSWQIVSARVQKR